MKQPEQSQQNLEAALEKLASVWPQTHVSEDLAQTTVALCEDLCALDQLAGHWPAGQAPQSLASEMAAKLNTLQDPAISAAQESSAEESQGRKLRSLWPQTMAPEGLAERVTAHCLGRGSQRSTGAGKLYSLFGSLAAAAVLLLTLIQRPAPPIQAESSLLQLWASELGSTFLENPELALDWDGLQELAELDEIETLDNGDSRMESLSLAMDDLLDGLDRF